MSQKVRTQTSFLTWKRQLYRSFRSCHNDLHQQSLLSCFGVVLFKYSTLKHMDIGRISQFSDKHIMTTYIDTVYNIYIFISRSGKKQQSHTFRIHFKAPWYGDSLFSLKMSACHHFQAAVNDVGIYIETKNNLGETPRIAFIQDPF